MLAVGDDEQHPREVHPRATHGEVGVALVLVGALRARGLLLVELGLRLGVVHRVAARTKPRVEAVGALHLTPPEGERGRDGGAVVLGARALGVAAVAPHGTPEGDARDVKAVDPVGGEGSEGDALDGGETSRRHGNLRDATW